MLKEFSETQNAFDLVKDLIEDVTFDWERIKSLRDLAGVLESLGTMIRPEVRDISEALKYLANILSEEAVRLEKR